jgi:nucleoside-diphosphate-sugar epimerase
MTSRTALVVGATGIVGLNLAQHLADQPDWQVYGLARNPSAGGGVKAVAADLLKPDTLTSALEGIEPTHVFLATWLRQPTEVENIAINAAMVRNLLQALSRTGSVQHVALVTGLKHYLGPFENYGKGKLPTTPFREEQARLDIDNFYYAQEDELFAAASPGVCTVRTLLSATR